MNTNYCSDVKTYFADSGFANPKISIEELLEPWKTAKEAYLLPLFQDQLIHSKTITIDETEKQGKRMNDLYDAYYSNFFKYFCKLETYADLSIPELLNNKTSLRHICPGKEYPIGMKVMRFLSSVIKDFPEHFPSNIKETLEEFRLEHSRILNTKTKDVTLNISIHPLDYITMSDNNENWTSCMSWDHEGEYHQGTIEMMNSASVIVAYIPSESNTYYNWNSKTWRKLYVVTPDFICGIKGYPYEIESVDGEVFKMIAELRPDHYSSSPRELYDREVTVNNKKLTLTLDTRLMYNDTICRAYRKIWFSENFLVSNTEENLYHIYSGVSQCMYCGTTNEEYGFKEHMRYCCSCEDYSKCDECGEWYYNEDMRYDGEECICNDCYNYRYVYSSAEAREIRREESIEYCIEGCSSRSSNYWDYLSKDAYEEIEDLFIEKNGYVKISKNMDTQREIFFEKYPIIKNHFETYYM